MNARQQRFVDEYMVDANATQAAIRAGYSERTAKQQGSKQLTKVDVQKAIAERAKGLKTSKIADAQEIGEFLTSFLRGGNDIKPRDQLQAAQQLAKLRGLDLPERKEEKVDITVTVVNRGPDA